MSEYFFGITDKGKRREKNEDTFIVREISNKEFLLACVIDGVGGYNGGDVAAGIARSVIMEHLKNLSGDVLEKIKHAIVVANEKINEEKDQQEKIGQMACVLTCAVADIKNNKFYYAHVGDTRLYLLRDNSLVKISKDHSAVGFLEESGRLSEEDAMRHPRRNEINKALGFEENINEIADFIETGESPFLPGDILLLCSDGLTDMISSNAILSILNNQKNLSVKAALLVDAANDAGGNDNITAVLVKNDKKSKQQPVAKPIVRKPETGKIKDVAGKPLPVQGVGAMKKKGQKFITVILLLSVVLLVALLAISFKKNDGLSKNIIAPVSKPSIQKNNDLLNFMLHVNDSTRSYSFKQHTAILKIADPILINKDSFQIIGNGVTLAADSLYKGAAFAISPSAKYIVLDSIVFKDFDVALLLQKNNIILRNVRFINCRVPIQYSVSLPDTIISGKLKDSIFINKNIK